MCGCLGVRGRPQRGAPHPQRGGRVPQGVLGAIASLEHLPPKPWPCCHPFHQATQEPKITGRGEWKKAGSGGWSAAAPGRPEPTDGQALSWLWNEVLIQRKLHPEITENDRLPKGVIRTGVNVPEMWAGSGGTGRRAGGGAASLHAGRKELGSALCESWPVVGAACAQLSPVEQRSFPSGLGAPSPLLVFRPHWGKCEAPR